MVTQEEETNLRKIKDYIKENYPLRKIARDDTIEEMSGDELRSIK